jgi:NitT/TauT family transport system substrate-binding protein
MGGVVGGLALHGCTQASSTTGQSSANSVVANGDPSTPAEPVSGATGSTLWIGYAPLYIALEKGFFREAGLELDHKIMGTTGEGNAAFAAGRLDGINLVTSEAVAFAAKDQDFRIVQVADISKGGDGILARNSVKSLEDFKGKEVAVEVGGVSHFFLLQVLEDIGLTQEDIKIRNLAPDAAAAAYQAGRVQIAVTYSPFLKQANDAQKDGRIIFDTSKMPAAIADLYIFSTEWVENNSGAAEAYVRGIFQGMEFLDTDPEEAHAIVGKRLQLKPEQVKTELQGVELTSLEDNIKMLTDPNSEIYLVKNMESMTEFLKQQKQIPETLPTERLVQLIDPTFVKAVQSNS